MDLIVKDSGIHGKGCYAGRAFKKGETVGEYVGERITDEEAIRRYGYSPLTYLFMIEDGICLDGTTTEFPLKYANHSCDPNCESDVKDGRVFVIALRDIAAGEEITYDYSLEVAEDDHDPCHCHCGHASCRGTMKDLN